MNNFFRGRFVAAAPSPPRKTSILNWPHGCRSPMLPLPPVVPEVMFRNTVILPREHMVRASNNDSIDPAVLGRLVNFTAWLERIENHPDGQLVASHLPPPARQVQDRLTSHGEKSSVALDAVFCIALL
jgi:hypothetical protein